MKYIYSLLVISVLVASCKKEEEEKLPSSPPTIELVSVTPTEVLQFKDSVIVTISYKDDNGDIGDELPDDYSMRVKDSRLSDPDWYHIQPLAPIGSELKFEGEIRIKINTLFILGNGSQELSNLSIKLKDRAGHWSNEITTPVITINDSL